MTNTSDFLTAHLHFDCQDNTNDPLFISAKNAAYSLSPSEIVFYVKKLAAGLIRAGLQPGDRIVVVPAPSVFDIVVLFGIVAARGIFSGCIPTTGIFEFTAQLTQIEPRFLLAPSEAHELISKSIERAQFPADRIFTVDEAPQTLGQAKAVVPGARSWTELLDVEDAGEYSWPQVDINEVICLLYTSGTSGTRKVVELTHGNFMASLDIQIDEYKHWKGNATNIKDRVDPKMHVLPILTSGTIAGVNRMCKILRMAANGFPVRCFIARPGLAKADAVDELLNLLSQHRITHIIALAHLFSVLAQVPQDLRVSGIDLSALSFLAISASSCPRSVITKARDFFIRHGASSALFISNGWGATEFTGVITDSIGLQSAHDLPDHLVGFLHPCMTGKVLYSPDSAGLPTDFGELFVRGSKVMKGYFRNPQATKAAFSSDGWYRTGDFGRLEVYPNGRTAVQLMGRAKENFKFNGDYICPAEVEAALLQHPRICEAAVIGIPGPRSEESGGLMPRAFVVGDVEPEEVIAFAKEELAATKKLGGGVLILDALPRNETGKVNKLVLRDI